MVILGNNKKILVIGAISGVAVNIVTRGIEGWFSTIILAIIVGSLIGGISAKFIFNDEEE